MECVLIVSDYELAGLEQAAASLITDINVGKSFARSIEDTVREGLIWKRLTEDSPKADKIQGFVKNASDSSVKRKRAEEIIRKEEKEAKELGESDGEPSAIIKNGVIYTHSDDWAEPAKTSLKKLLNSDEAPRQEIAAESISAEVNGCRDDPSLHEKLFGNLELKDQPLDDEKKPTEFSKPVEVRNLPRPNLLQPRIPIKQFKRNMHAVGTKKSNYEERNLRRRRQENFKQYIMEDRKRVQSQAKQPSEKVEELNENLDKYEKAAGSKYKTLKAAVSEEPLKPFPREEKQQNQYKGLNHVAKQKIRCYNAQKKFSPSASVLVMLEKRRKEKTEKSVITAIQERSEKKYEEYKKKLQQEPEEKEEEKEKEKEKEEEVENNQAVSLIAPEKDENTKHREFIIRQLHELKKENETLKKRLTELTKEKKMEAALQVQSDNLELERTKLKACWLIMTSTMEAFSNFCKKFTTKSNSKSLQKAVHNIEAYEAEDTDEEYEDALNHIAFDVNKPTKEDDKYFRFLQKLMEDQIGPKKVHKGI